MSTGNTDLEWEKQSLHSFELPYSQVTNFELDYVNLVYVLYCYKNGQQMCRFNFPQEFCNATYLRYEKIKLRDNDCDCRPITVSNKMILVLVASATTLAKLSCNFRIATGNRSSSLH